MTFSLGIDDLQICRALLESKNWDLEATAREQFDPQDQNEVIIEQPLSPHDEAPEASNYQNNHPLPRIIPEGNPNHRTYQENAFSVPGSQNSYPNRDFGASNSSNFPVHRSANQGAFGLLRWGIYLITLPIAWPVRLAYNSVTNVFGFVADLLGFGHLFGFLRNGTQRGRRLLPRPPVIDPKGNWIKSN